jgi:hypothetical protein
MADVRGFAGRPDRGHAQPASDDQTAIPQPDHWTVAPVHLGPICISLIMRETLPVFLNWLTFAPSNPQHG